MGNPKKYLDYDGLTFLINRLKDLFGHNTQLDDLLNYETGSNTVTTLTNIPITKQAVWANLKSNSSFSLAGIPADGKYIHVMVKNSGAKTIAISLPSASPYVQTNTDVLNIPANKIGEINALSNGTNIFLRAV